MVNLVTNNGTLLFLNQYKEPYAQIQIGQGINDFHFEAMKIESKKFELYLRKLFFERQNRTIPSQEALNSAIKQLESMAVFDGHTETIHLRVAWGQQNQEIIYDLTNDDHEYVIINQEGWYITKNPEKVFVRFNQTPQVIPSKEYPADILDRLLDLFHIIDPQHRILTKVWIISCFIADIPRTINDVHGEKGAAKSTFCAFIKRLIDPDTLELLTLPKDPDTLVQQLHHNYLAIYDNLKHVPYWLSDDLCRAATGIGNSKRKLFTDEDDIIRKYRRCIMVNGIVNVLEEPDFLDRSVMTELARIPTENRRELAQVEAEFEAMRPKLLGYIFDTLVKALKIKPALNLQNLKRMADFEAWGEAISLAMGNRPGLFREAYDANIGRQNVEAIELNPLAQAVQRFMAEKESWEGLTADFLKELEAVAVSNNLNMESKLWPKKPNVLSRKIKPILSNLREGFGIDVKIETETSGQNKGLSSAKVRKISLPSQLSLLDENHAQNEGKNGKDIESGQDSESLPTKVSLPENDQNHAQNQPSKDSKDSKDIFPTLGGLPCPYGCEQTFPSLDELQDHGIKKHPGRPITADLQKMGFEV